MSNIFTLDELSPYIATELNVSVDTKFKFLSYITNVAAIELYKNINLDIRYSKMDWEVYSCQ